MADTLVFKGRQAGATESARQQARKAALEKHQAALSKHRDSLQATELAREPSNFYRWCEACDFTITQAGLEDFVRITRARAAIDSADQNGPGSRGSRAARYAELGRPYLEYAEQALARRFPTRGARAAQGGAP